MTKDSTPLSNSELRDKIEQALKEDFNNLLVKEFTTDWKVQRLKIALDIEIMDFDNIVQLIEQVCNESRKDELKQLWNYTQSDIVPEGAKPNDMSDRLHERIQTLTKESES